jgi:single-stranded-DNA-specific exonuclease
MTAWKKNPVDRELVRAIAKKYSCDLLTAFILMNRGISEDEIPYFLSDDPLLLHDPFLLPGINEAIERIRKALISKEKVLVFGDRDTDGITGTVLLADYLQSLGMDVSWRVPIADEPYGLSIQAVEEFSSANGSLIVTVDCGISNMAEIAYAGALALDVIVTDHHTPKEVLPEALAIVNPKLPTSVYPFPDVSGCVISYKLVCALQASLKDFCLANFAQKESEYIQLATLGTVADIVPLRNENRTIVRNGLKAMMEKPRYGISELLICLGLAGKRITAKELAWIVCPTLNAPGRMGTPDKVVDLLLSKYPLERIRLSGEIKSLNEKRRRLGTKTWPLIEQQAAQSLKRFDDKLAMAAGTHISRGITGVMANRLVDCFNIPAMAVHLGREIAIGSIRSPGNYDIRLLLEPIDDILLAYGGHINALGFSLQVSLWEQFIDRLEIEIGNIHCADMPDEVLVVDAELPKAYIAPDVLAIVDRFEPYGTGNDPLVFVSQGLKVIASVLVGKKEPKHLKIVLDADRHKWNAFLWKAAENLKREINAGDVVDMVYSFERNIYHSVETPQLVIKGIRKGYKL